MSVEKVLSEMGFKFQVNNQVSVYMIEAPVNRVRRGASS